MKHDGRTREPLPPVLDGTAAHAGPYRDVGAVSGTDSLAQALLCLFFGGVKCGFECGERGAEQVW